MMDENVALCEPDGIAAPSSPHKSPADERASVSPIKPRPPLAQINNVHCINTSGYEVLRELDEMECWRERNEVITVQEHDSNCQLVSQLLHQLINLSITGSRSVRAKSTSSNSNDDNNDNNDNAQFVCATFSPSPSSPASKQAPPSPTISATTDTTLLITTTTASPVAAAKTFASGEQASPCGDITRELADSECIFPAVNSDNNDGDDHEEYEQKEQHVETQHSQVCPTTTTTELAVEQEEEEGVAVMNSNHDAIKPRPSAAVVAMVRPDSSGCGVVGSATAAADSVDGLVGSKTAVMMTPTEQSQEAASVPAPDTVEAVSATGAATSDGHAQLLCQQEQLLQRDRSIDQLKKDQESVRAELAVVQRRVERTNKLHDTVLRAMARVVAEAEDVRSGQAAEKERVSRECDEAHTELDNMHSMYTDLNRKFERTRTQLLERKQRSELANVELQEAMDSLSQRRCQFCTLMEHASGTWHELRAHHDKQAESKGRECLQLSTKLRLRENKVAQLEQENAELTEMCNELIRKMDQTHCAD